MYLTILMVPVGLYIYRYITRKIIENEKNIKDFVELRNSVQTFHPEYNKIKLYKETVKLVFYKYKEEFLQKKFGIVSECNKNGNNIYYVSYYKNYTLYKIPIRNHKKQIKNIIVFDQNDQDITQEVKPFMGFNYDFHRISLTPNDIGYEKLKFCITSEGNEEEFNFYKNDIMML